MEDVRCHVGCRVLVDHLVCKVVVIGEGECAGEGEGMRVRGGAVKTGVIYVA